jgi:hypothetical protein
MNIKGVACDSQPETVCCVHHPGPDERLCSVVDELLDRSFGPREVMNFVTERTLEHLSKRFSADIEKVMDE